MEREEKVSDGKEVIASVNAKICKDTACTTIEVEGNDYYLVALASSMLGALYEHGFPKSVIDCYLKEAFKNEE